MRKLVVALVAFACIALATSANAAGIKAYASVSGAQKHCPTDEVVWANSASIAGVFHLKGSKFYGTTKNGAYVCRKEAEGGGWHAAENNQ